MYHYNYVIIKLYTNCSEWNLSFWMLFHYFVAFAKIVQIISLIMYVYGIICLFFVLVNVFVIFLYLETSPISINFELYFGTSMVVNGDK